MTTLITAAEETRGRGGGDVIYDVLLVENESSVQRHFSRIAVNLEEIEEIYQTRKISFPNTEKRLQNTTRSGVFFVKL